MLVSKCCKDVVYVDDSLAMHYSCFNCGKPAEPIEWRDIYANHPIPKEPQNDSRV